MTVTSARLIDQLRTARRLPPPAARRSIRLLAGATQQQVAEELEVNRVTVARWELGQREPRGPLRARYVALLDQLLRAHAEGASDREGVVA